MQFGAREIPGTEFQEVLGKSIVQDDHKGKWQSS